MNSNETQSGLRFPPRVSRPPGRGSEPLQFTLLPHTYVSKPLKTSVLLTGKQSTSPQNRSNALFQPFPGTGNRQFRPATGCVLSASYRLQRFTLAGSTASRHAGSAYTTQMGLFIEDSIARKEDTSQNAKNKISAKPGMEPRMGCRLPAHLLPPLARPYNRTRTCLPL